MNMAIRNMATKSNFKPRARTAPNPSAAALRLRMYSSSRADSSSPGDATPEEQVESLYLGFFSRKPHASELADATAALGNGLSMTDLTWVLFNTREFVFVE